MTLPFVLDPTRAALALGIAAAVVTVLYLLRERYRPVLVSYLPLWEQSVRRSTPLALARKLRKLLSLLLQLVIVALTVWALTDPGWGESRPPRQVVLLVDVSPSMDARDGTDGGSRLAQAVHFARALTLAAREHDRFLAVAVSAMPVVQRSWDSRGPALTRSLGELAVDDTEADLGGALRFARAALTGREHGEI